ncbi:hypothetical protein K474DRAFT_1667959 [Panus rudis PR-1116 ss-1]|nr:hypothetical protein K474DRAFT_1667959 [Panus rudis PR-1116 ss-1]
MGTVNGEVLRRDTRFIHSEIWIEHVGWKYAQVADRFEIGRRISSLLPTSTSSQVCLLEEVLCVRGTATSVTSHTTSTNDPIDALAAYVKKLQVLFRVALCSSLAACDGMPPTIVGHLSDPEGTVASLVRIVMHPYDDSKLRDAVWKFITLAVDNEPALAKSFATGHFRTPTPKGKEKAQEEPASKQNSALTLSVEMLEEWQGIWESNPCPSRRPPNCLLLHEA